MSLLEQEKQDAVSHAEKSHDPLYQFEIKPLFSDEMGLFTFTNSSLWMVIAVLAVIALMVLPTRKNAVIPGRWQALSESFYGFVADMIRDNIGSGGKKFFPFIFTLFMFILSCNLMGMIPAISFTVTSHIIVTFALAALVFLITTIYGFYKHGLHFFSLFCPSGVPMAIAPLMVVIELFSFLARPFTLSIRLAANMFAGHLLMKVMAGFVVAMGIGGFAPLGLITVFTGFEIFIACLQAYIFSILACVYLHDAVHLH